MQTALLLTVLAPALAAAGLIALALAGGRGGRASAAATTPLAFIAPFGALAACVPVRGWPGVPPNDASLWPIWLGFVIAVYAAVEGARQMPAVSTWLGRGALSIIVAVLVAKPLMVHQWSAAFSALVAVTAGAISTVCWSAVAHRAGTARGPGLPLGLAALCAVAAATLGASGTALLAQCVGGMAAGLGLYFLAALKWPDLSARTVVGPVIALLAGFLLGGVLYAEVRLVSVALLVVAALAVGLVPWPPKLATGLRSAVAYGVIVAVLGGAAVGASLLPRTPTAEESSPGDDGGDDYDGYGY